MTDTVVLQKINNHLSSYSLNFLLNKYNVITLCPPDPNDGYGPGDMRFQQHTVGGVLVRGDLYIELSNSIGSSESSTSPSAIGDSIIYVANVSPDFPVFGGTKGPENRHVDLYIGDENDQKELKDFSVVTFKHKVGNKDLGTIGIIGPKRMDYSKVISVMKYISKKLNDNNK